MAPQPFTPMGCHPGGAAFAAALAFLACAGPARAQTAATSAAATPVTALPDVTLPIGVPAGTAPDWIVTIGVGGEFGPKYPGSDRSGFSVVPSDFDIRRADEPAGLGAPDDSFELALIDLDRFSMGPAAGYRTGRSPTDDPGLYGLAEVPVTLDVGGFAEYWLVPDALRARIELRQAVKTTQGLLADVSADWFRRFGPVTVSLGPRLSVGDTAYMRTMYGVTETEALANGVVTPFQPSGGVQSYGALASLSYAFSPSWSATAYGRVDKLVGDAADSPITRSFGSDYQTTVGLGVSYSFGVATP
ncbi:MipA/OmpV family protein [Ancylobacter sp. 6x-1]|uniref:MipA/OmpV family protein n=1 Tax=Ancylobacter crimeensis TaxID=2579147 RepID=A0ABT0D9V8_9HYPH|nr:MipA/OmpV family protein [Ancylobacter crimeensis]MCK0196741.1 MipA/OmpV family protein [Ancylobacter crimeensis]